MADIVINLNTQKDFANEKVAHTVIKNLHNGLDIIAENAFKDLKEQSSNMIELEDTIARIVRELQYHDYGFSTCIKKEFEKLLRKEKSNLLLQ